MFCLGRPSGKGPHLAWRGETPGFSRVAAGPSRVMMGTSGARHFGLRKGKSTCELLRASQDSSPVGAGA